MQDLDSTHHFVLSCNLVSHIIGIIYINVYYQGLGIRKSWEWCHDLRLGSFDVNCVNKEELHMSSDLYSLFSKILVHVSD